MAAKSASLALLLLVLAGVVLRPSEAIQAIYSPGALFSGQFLLYVGYKLIMQSDCNLVLYDRDRAIWSSGTYGKGFSNCVTRMQNDGNLVVYAPGGKALWASGTNRGPGRYQLILQRDRNVVIYDGAGKAIWATNTNI